MSRHISTAEAAKLLGKSPRTVRRMANGPLRGRTPAGRLVFDLDENPTLKALMEAQREATTAADQAAG